MSKFYTFDKAICEPRLTPATKCSKWTHVFAEQRAPKCECGQRTWEDEQESSIRFCDCGMAAVKYSRGFPVCERCDRIEHEVLCHDTRDQFHR